LFCHLRWDAVTAFVREDDVTPLLVTPILSLQCPLKTLLSVSYNATNSTNDRPRCGRPQVTTARQNRLMVRQHLRNRFTRATETLTSIGKNWKCTVR
jgi:hypothetical protein